MPFYLLSSFHQSVMEIFRPLLNWFDSVSMLRSLQPYRDWLPYVTVGVVLPFLLWIFLSILRQVRRNSRSGKNVRPSPAPAGMAVQGKAIDITTDFVVHDPWTEPSLGAQAAPAPQPDLSLRPQEQGISAPVPDRTNSWIAPDSAVAASPIVLPAPAPRAASGPAAPPVIPPEAAPAGAPAPSATPAPAPSVAPAPAPSAPSATPAPAPSAPSATPAPAPSVAPAPVPSAASAPASSAAPAPVPSATPASAPSAVPTPAPSAQRHEAPEPPRTAAASPNTPPESEFQRIYIDMYIDLELTTNFSALRTDVNGMLSRGVSSEPLLPEGSATPEEYVLACIALAALEDLQTKESRLESGELSPHGQELCKIYEYILNRLKGNGKLSEDSARKLLQETLEKVLGTSGHQGSAD